MYILYMINLDKEILNKFFNNSFFRHTKSLKNFKNYEIRFNKPDDLDKYSNYITHIEEQLYSEFQRYINKEAINIIEDSKNFDIIDYIGKNIDDGILSKDLISLIANSNYSNIITNSNIGSILQDSTSFHFSKIENRLTNYSHSPYMIGKINNTMIFIDPFMKFNDNRIIMFNDISINIENIKNISHNAESNLQGISFNYDIEKSESRVIYIIESEKSESYMKYKQFNRNNKIDEILNK